MKQPEITVTFTELAATAIARGERGIIAMILKSDATQGAFSYTKSSEVPTTLEEGLYEQIQLAFKGYVNPPRKVIGFILPATDYAYTIVVPETGDDPSAHGWYELVGGEYILSTDSLAKSGTAYYEKSYAPATPEEGDDPSAKGWYEKTGDMYTLTEDTAVQDGKTYYALSYAAATVEYASNPSTENWYELLNGEYTRSADTFPATGKAYYSRSAKKVPVKDYTAAYDYLKGVRYQYLVVPTAATDGMTSSLASFVKEQRADGNLIKAVLPDTPADSEGVINLATSTFVEGDKSYTAEQFCSRVAGIIAGTPLTMSATYAPLLELSDCTRMTRAEADDAADKGKLVALWDGEKVKMGRAINSLITTSQTKNTQFQKIKIVDAMDMISDDITKTCEDSYIGKYANTFSNKLTLIGAISGYFDVLKRDSVIDDYTIDIDVEANETYLKGRGVDTSSMSAAQIRQANTGSYVFLVAKLSMLDAIEDIILRINI